MTTLGMIALIALYATYLTLLVFVFVWLHREYHPRRVITSARHVTTARGAVSSRAQGSPPCNPDPRSQR